MDSSKNGSGQVHLRNSGLNKLLSWNFFFNFYHFFLEYYLNVGGSAYRFNMEFRGIFLNPYPAEYLKMDLSNFHF